MEMLYRTTMPREDTSSSWAEAMAEIGGLEDSSSSSEEEEDDGNSEMETSDSRVLRSEDSKRVRPSLPNKKSMHSTPSTARSGTMMVITERSSGRETIELLGLVDASMEEEYEAAEVGYLASGLRSPPRSRPHTEEMNDESLKRVCVLGVGSFGRVLLCRLNVASTETLYAVKRIPATKLSVPKHVERTRTERDVLVELQGHPHVVTLYFAYRSETHLVLGFEYCPGGELFHHLAKSRTLSPACVIFYAAELALAFDHCHSHAIIYRDLKPENCLLTANGHLKLADFGLAKIGIKHPFHGVHSICGTLEYIAPDILANREQGYGYAVDYWGLGILSYELLTGYPPFRSRDKAKLFKAIKQHDPPLLKNTQKIPSQCADLLTLLLKRNPHQRIHSLADLRTQPVFAFYNISLDTVSNSPQPPIRPCDPHSVCCFLKTPKGIEKAHWINFDLKFTTLSVNDHSSELKRPPNHGSLPADAVSTQEWNYIKPNLLVSST